MDSKAGSILLLISGIFTFLFAALLLVLTLIVPFLAESGSDGAIAAIVLGVLFVLLLVSGILKLYASKMMKFSKSTANGGIIALVVGVLNGDILAIVGGILGIVQGGQ